VYSQNFKLGVYNYENSYNGYWQLFDTQFMGSLRLGSDVFRVHWPCIIILVSEDPAAPGLVSWRLGMSILSARYYYGVICAEPRASVILGSEGYG